MLWFFLSSDFVGTGMVDNYLPEDNLKWKKEEKQQNPLVSKLVFYAQYSYIRAIHISYIS